MAVDGLSASSVEAAELPEMPVERADQMAAAVVAEAAIGLKRPKMTPITAAAAASDYVGIDPFVLLPGERWISQYLSFADFVNYSIRC